MIRKLLPYLWLLVFFYLLALAQYASTQEVAPDAARLTWTNATESTTGAPLPATGPESIATNRAQRSLCEAGDTFGTVLETLNVPASVNVLLFEGLPTGRYCFRVRHVAEDGEVSAWSRVVAKSIAAPAGKPKQPLTITVE